MRKRIMDFLADNYVWFVLVASLAVAIPAWSISYTQMPSKGVVPYADNGDGTFTAQSASGAVADVTLSDSQIDLVLTDTATVYSYTLPAKTVAYEFQARGTGVVDYSWVDTTVATVYTTLKSGYPYNTFGLGSEKIYTGTIYFKCPLTAGEIMEIHAIYKP